MLPLFDMLTNAQNGKAMELLARQFNLSQQQAELAVEALMPAFSQGLKRNVSDPFGVAGFMNAMASGSHAKYFEDARAAFTPQGVEEGNGILGHLFGSKELSRAVAAQAAQATGIGQEVLKQMLPAIASMIMGGLFKQSTSQGGAAGSNPLGQIIEQMMRQAGGMMGSSAAQGRAAPASPFDNPFGKVLEGMFGGGTAAQPSQNPFGENPFGKIFEEMMGGGRATPQSDQRRRKSDHSQGGEEAADAPRRRTTDQTAGEASPYDDLFGKMFDAGAKHREDYQKGVESIFEQFSKGMDRYK